MKIVLAARPDEARLSQLAAAYPEIDLVAAGSGEEVLREIVDASALTTALTRDIFAENVGHFARGEPFRNIVDQRLGY